MSELIPQSAPVTVVLTKDLAQKHLSRLTELANLIPGVEYTAEDILSEQKGDRQMFGKWQHSLMVVQDNEPVAFVMGYERVAEENEQYPQNTLYLSELAVAEAYQGQGIARDLLLSFFEHNNALGFQSLEGELTYSLQTNSADWNSHVIDLYKSLGFAERATKEYSNRTDLVLGLEASELQFR